MSARIAEQFFTEGDLEGLKNEVRARFLADLKLTPEKFQSLGEQGVKDEIVKAAEEFYRRKEEQISPELMSTLEKMAMLQVIDAKWRDHLREMDDLKEGIHLRGYGQKDPLVEYKTEAFKMFMELMELIANDALNLVFKFFPERVDQVPAQRGRRPVRREDMVMTHESALGAGFEAGKEPVPADASGNVMQGGARPPRNQPIRVGEKVGRNDPCPCGSGKKYKNCHGA